MTLDDKVRQHIHETVEHVRGITYSTEYQAYQTNLLDILNSALQEPGVEKLVFKDDAHKREVSDNVWDKAADVIARVYLKMDDNKIKEMKEQKTADGVPIWENFIANYLGFRKEDFFDRFFKEREYLTADDIKGIHSQLSEAHLSRRTGDYLGHRITTQEHAQATTEYLKAAKEKLPLEFEGVEVQEYTQPEEARGGIVKHAGRISSAYDPGYN